MSSLKIALLQIAPEADLADNLIKGEKYCRMAAECGADIALFPEMFSCGYDIADTPFEKWNVLHEGNSFCGKFKNLAKELGMAIGITCLAAGKNGPENTLFLYDWKGNLALRYSKVHTCDFAAERHLARGNDFPVCTLSTAAGDIKVGAMICYDREFPESARILMLRGAELILVPNACPMEINRLAQLRARAFENMTAIATCNYPAGVPDCNGHSTVFSGMAWADGDMCLLDAGEQEGAYFAVLNINKLRSYREEETTGNTYRRPALYGELCNKEVMPPFVRKDARR